MKALTLKLSIKIPAATPVDSLILSDRSLSKKQSSLIIDNIYLSGYHFAQDYDFLKKNKFTHIINCAAGSQRFHPYLYHDFTYELINLKDNPGEDIEEGVKKVINFIEKATEEDPNRKILVHCFEGISRGPALLTAYLMWKYCLDKDQAIGLIKEKRPCVEINLGFMCQLDQLENKFRNLNEL